ncbi:MAG: hypothetical protein FWH47_04275 [Methanomassiliicoccaceae archaeon]|nr:hypothetical protein [Methanomassiliicoccaceae archaeon]
MNRFDGKEMNDVFYKYYHGMQIDPKDKPMLDKLVMASHMEYTIRDGKAFAEASKVGKMMHYRPPISLG